MHGWSLSGSDRRKSGIPVEEGAVQGQSMVRALFGMKLRGENIIARNCSAKSPAVVRLARNVARIRRLGVEAVHKVKVASVRHVAPNWMRGAAMVALKH